MCQIGNFSHFIGVLREETITDIFSWVIWREVWLYFLFVPTLLWLLTGVSFYGPVSVLKPRFLWFHGTGSGTSVLYPILQYQGFGTGFLGGYLHFPHFGISSVPFWCPNQVEPKAVVLEPQLTET